MAGTLTWTAGTAAQSEHGEKKADEKQLKS